MKFQMTHVDFVCAADIGWLRLHLVDLVFQYQSSLSCLERSLGLIGTSWDDGPQEKRYDLCGSTM